ncbi:Armadillo-type fold protein [Drechmeria coniospora]|uniref:Armadillo-type fold protein n=1 Tax=Drechmeria coniospora TaxID=98403 RepID=A0A151GFN6_DRECN|nr:Armadillo-type fold protein [Drechmeria coniospora]KYK55909.1 Armadillo-type fold protein [Drechmeria coniospora]
MEDVARVDLNVSSKYAFRLIISNRVFSHLGSAGLYNVILQNVSDAASLMAAALSTQTHDDAIRCMQPWVGFAQRVSSQDNYVAGSLRPLVETVFSTLTEDKLFSASAELLVDILSNYPSLMVEEHYEYLADLFTTNWAQQRYQKLLQGDFEVESIQFGQLLLGFGEVKMETLLRKEDGRTQHVLLILCGLLAAKGYPVAKDTIFVPTVEFWSTFAQSATDSVLVDNQAMPSKIVSVVWDAVSNAWQKIEYPPSEEFHQWDSADRVGFADARKDVVDLLQSAYTLVGPSLVTTFVNLTREAMSSSAWLRLEAAAFCLGGLADCGRDDNQFDDGLAQVFLSLSSVLRRTIPSRTRQTCLSLIEHFTDYFERNVADLTSALRLLFSLLLEKSMAASASRSILRLCSACRHHLYPHIHEFLDKYSLITCGGHIDCISSEKVLNAIACVAQAIPDPLLKQSACVKILGFVQNDVHHACELVASTNPVQHPCLGLRCLDGNINEQPGFHIGQRALRSLVGVGKGFKSPADGTIDLNAGNSQRGAQDGLYQLVHSHIIHVIRKLESIFGQNPETIELISGVLRCGFSETEPGPFVLDPDMVAGYLASHTSVTTRIGLLVGTACSFTSSLHCRQLRTRFDYFSNLFLWVVGLLKELQESDPELTQNGIEFATTLLTTEPVTILRPELALAVEYFMPFTLRVLDGKEPLPKGAAADFWSTFVSLDSDDESLQQAVKTSMKTLGPPLVLSLSKNIGGNASRSELDKLSEPVKKLVIRYTGAKEWLQSGLGHPSFPSDKISPEQKALFVERVISLRGQRATNQVIRDFWLLARGSNFAYIT